MDKTMGRMHSGALFAGAASELPDQQWTYAILLTFFSRRVYSEELRD
ncbi:hypothetical protein [Candidatus Electronema sp. TJ]